MKRSEFIKASTVAGLGMTFFKPNLVFGRDDRKVRLGFIGVGGRGTSHLRRVLKRDDVVVTNICDIDKEALNRARDLVVQAGGKKPRGFSRNEVHYRDMVEREDMDGIIISTPWKWHVPMTVDTMNAGKYAGLEVPAAVTLDECWQLVRTYEATKVPCMILENVCYRRDVMAALNMVRQGLFGELVHAHCGYQHDLRGIKFNPGAEFGPDKGEGEAKWRTQHSIDRNGDIYPTHGVGPVATMMEVNRGNRFVHLTSTATKSRGLHNYIVEKGGVGHPNAGIKFTLGDIVTTVIKTARGETMVVSHDTNLPRPYSLMFRIQGTHGLWLKDNDSIYIEGRSPEEHEWESFAAYQEEFDHPLWRRYGEQAEGAGHGGMDFFVTHAFIESVKRKVSPPLDVYDAAAWSAISPLSEQSIAEGSTPMQFPDFTQGKWENRKPVFALDDDF
ncbi:MAG: Gfo/Idh/MocA family oxidoreductase [Fidelibacterota bacterium]|nr:MAG: Gfo/Idh/MocA family oxidoreductase [Candidatus Neomarinimicrobiota bacterium]